MSRDPYDRWLQKQADAYWAPPVYVCQRCEDVEVEDKGGICEDCAEALREYDGPSDEQVIGLGGASTLDTLDADMAAARRLK